MAKSGITDGANGIGGIVSSLFDKAVCPLALRFAELFMMIIIGIYVAKLVVLGMGFSSGYGFREMTLISFIVDVGLMFMTFDSLLTLSSTDPRSWKKAVRAAVLLVVINLIYKIGLSTTAASMISFNPIAIMIVSIFVLICLFLPQVRDHYVPSGLQMPSLKSWVAFAAFWPLFPFENYRMSFNEWNHD